MKKIIIPFLLLSTAAMADINVSDITAKKEGRNIHCSYRYPQFSLNGKSLTKLNNSFKRDIQEMNRKTPKKVTDLKAWDRTVNFKEFKNDFGFTSVVISDRINTGSNQDVTNLRSVNLDPKTGKLLDFNDIFRSELNDRVKKAIVKYLNEKNIEKGIGFFNPIEEECISLDNAVFYFDRNYLIMKFEGFSVAPYNKKEFVYRFEKENVVPYMQYKYGKDFPEYYKNGRTTIKFSELNEKK